MDPVAYQLEAYNARDIERFIACYDPEVRIEDGETYVRACKRGEFVSKIFRLI